MDKQDTITTLKEHLSTQENAVYLHFVDGSTLLISSMPQFVNMHMRIKNTYSINNEIVEEVISIPYSSIIYMTLTNANNLRIVNKQYQHVKPEELEDLF